MLNGMPICYILSLEHVAVDFVPLLILSPKCLFSVNYLG